jgi:hypothetical protein
MTDPSQESNDSSGFLRPSVAQVMDIEDVTMGRTQEYVVRFRGRLKMDSQEAYAKLEPEFHKRNFTPLFRLEDDRHVILAASGVVRPRQTNPWINIGLMVLTLISMFYTGASYAYTGPTDDMMTALLYPLLHLWEGWPFGLSMIAILLAHEFGHYIAARLHKSPTTLPYFIPMPLSPFGTMGAVIAITAPVRNRRVLHDIGVSGPLAGLVVAIPILIIGLMRSHIEPIPVTLPVGIAFEGNSLLYLTMKFLMFGKLLPMPADYGFGGPLVYWLRYFFTGTPLPAGGQDVILDAVAWAGWAGLLVTGLNLIPAGQLDGGHALFVLIGKRVQKIVPIIIGILVALGFFWQGWWLWAAIIFFLNRRPAELLDEITPLDTRRRWIAIGVLIIFVLVVTPIPLTGVGV